jgi:SAM-dependent methyltransferase
MVVAMLRDRGYRVTAIDKDPCMVESLRDRFPEAVVRHGDLADLMNILSPQEMEQGFDLVTMLDTAQYVPPDLLQSLLVNLRRVVRNRLILDVSNVNSIYVRWILFRQFKSPWGPVYPLSCGDIERMLEAAGFRVAYRKGIGLLLPLSLFSNYRATVVPSWLAILVSMLDFLFPRWCHQYYIEAV